MYSDTLTLWPHLLLLPLSHTTSFTLAQWLFPGYTKPALSSWPLGLFQSSWNSLPPCKYVMCSLTSFIFSFSLGPSVVILCKLTTLPPTVLSIHLSLLYFSSYHLSPFDMFIELLCLRPLDSKLHEDRYLVCSVSQPYTKVPCSIEGAKEKFQCWMNF